jgi:hypothetical protein
MENRGGDHNDEPARPTEDLPHHAFTQSAKHHSGGQVVVAKRIELGLDCAIVGMSEIKRRRLEELDVDCHPGTRVGYYVPFYFCPRSIMLYILHQGNHPDLNYDEGQGPIVHLQADLEATVEWANENGVRWAFSNANAGARYTSFYTSFDRLDQVNWVAVAATDFRSVEIKDGKQAEFLVFESFPWNLVERIGVINEAVSVEVKRSLTLAEHQPSVVVERSWYY